MCVCLHSIESDPDSVFSTTGFIGSPTPSTVLSVSNTGTSLTVFSHCILLSASIEPVACTPTPFHTPRAMPKSELVRLGDFEWSGGGGRENQVAGESEAGDRPIELGKADSPGVGEDGVGSMPDPMEDVSSRLCRRGRRDSAERYWGEGIRFAWRWTYDQVIVSPSVDEVVDEVETERLSSGEGAGWREGTPRPKPDEYDGLDRWPAPDGLVTILGRRGDGLAGVLGASIVGGGG